MDENRVNLSEDDYNLGFLASEEEPKACETPKLPYKILVADDDPEMHSATRLVLRNFRFEGHPLQLLEARTGKEAMEILRTTGDIALILLDVVMEESDTGLKVVDFIRKTLGNRNIRIVLRTGQPGEAPEERIIAEYDINDYRLKTELTVQRLFTTMYEALRSYRDLMELERRKKGLEQIIGISSRLFTLSSIEAFYSCILDQLLSFRDMNASAFYFREPSDTGGLVFLDQQTFGTIIAATGRFSGMIGRNVEELEDIRPVIEQAEMLRQDSGDAVKALQCGCLVHKCGQAGCHSFIYIEGADLNLDTELIRIFLSNYSAALDNFLINRHLLDAQKERITALHGLLGRMLDPGESGLACDLPEALRAEIRSQLEETERYLREDRERSGETC